MQVSPHPGHDENTHNVPIIFSAIFLRRLITSPGEGGVIGFNVATVINMAGVESE